MRRLPPAATHLFAALLVGLALPGPGWPGPGGWGAGDLQAQESAAPPPPEDSARGPDATDRSLPLRPVTTYSIVGRDSATGQLGAAVQSHWFSVGTDVPWVAAGVGAVATQSFTDPSYGRLGLEMLRTGRPAPSALEGLVAADPSPEVRQVGMVDARGRAAVHTGDRAIAEACDRTGPGFAVQANLMHHGEVCAAMDSAYRAADGDLAARLFAALEAAQAAGGDIRGKQSAALVVGGGDPTAPSWERRIFDLRVDDHADPLRELGRLLEVARAYRHMNEGDRHVTAGDMEAAVREYRAAEELLPNRAEPYFWHAVNLVNAGRVEDALPLFAKAFRIRAAWRELVPRLPESGLLPDNPELIREIRRAGREGG